MLARSVKRVLLPQGRRFGNSLARASSSGKRDNGFYSVALEDSAPASLSVRGEVVDYAVGKTQTQKTRSACRMPPTAYRLAPTTISPHHHTHHPRLEKRPTG
jgi:hypothetical protein